MRAIGARTLAALALQLGALTALVSALHGASWLDARSKPRVLVLVDRSLSMPQDKADEALADVEHAARQAGRLLQVIEFAGRPAAPSPSAAHASVGLEPSATNVEAAVQAALATHADEAVERMIVISDGFASAGDTVRGLNAAREARLPLHWIAIGRPAPQVRLGEVLAPDRALVDQRIRVAVQLAGRPDRPLRIAGTAHSASGEARTETAEVGASGRALVEFDAIRAGVIRVDLAVQDPASGTTIDALADAAAVDVVPRAPILYAQGTAGVLAQSLARGGWTLSAIPATRLDDYATSLDAYDAVVLDDVSVADAGPRFWSALVAAVRDRGLGLMVLGGERSFARGGYHGSLLESVLPVASEPAAADQPAAIVFAVDKSGSMGQGSGGVDRFQMAQRAVLETARALTARDSLGLLVFDVVPRVLNPLGPAPATTAALERNWGVGPRGGTRLSPALEAAIGELERSGSARRILVLVTDGFVDDAPLDRLRARLGNSRIETVALAVGPDADVSALQRLVGEGAGTVLRVSEAAELPVVMRSGVERRRAKVERGTIAVEQRQPLPFPPGVLENWPSIAAYPVTRSQPQASVVLQSQHGEPLIALQRSGRGRVVAITCGLGRWTPRWLQWQEWPRLAGGLADWIIGSPQGGGFALSVSDLPSALMIDVDAPAATGRVHDDGVSLTATTPAMQQSSVSLDHVAPNRMRALLPDAGPGLYALLLSTPLGTHRQLHVRRNGGETRVWGVNPMLEQWQGGGLMSQWDRAVLAEQRDGGGHGRPLDRSLMALGLGLILAGVLVDRMTLPAAGLRRRLRRGDRAGHDARSRSLAR